MVAIVDATVGELARGVAGLDLPELWRAIATAAPAAVVVAGVSVVVARRRRGGGPAALGVDQWALVVVAGCLAGVGVRVGAAVAVVLAALVATAGGTVPPRRRRGSAVVDGAAVLLASVGLYGTLPEPQVAAAVVGAAGVALLGAALVASVADDLAPLSWPAAAVVLGTLAASVGPGSGGRARAVLAALLVLAAFVVTTTSAFGERPVHALAADLLVTGASSRWVGLAPDLGGAAVRAAVVLTVAAVLVVGARRRGASGAQVATDRDGGA